MTQEHPITPPPELIEKWLRNYYMTKTKHEELTPYLATQAARWGADMELEACCEWLQDPDLNVDTYKLRAHRRPKPPSLKEQALTELNLTADPEGAELSRTQVELIRRALESLPE